MDKIILKRMYSRYRELVRVSGGVFFAGRGIHREFKHVDQAVRDKLIRSFASHKLSAEMVTPDHVIKGLVHQTYNVRKAVFKAQYKR